MSSELDAGSSTELSLRSGVEWREVEGEIVALDVDRSLYLAVNASGALMWRLLQGGTTREALVRALTDEYQLDSAAASRDVDAFLAELEAQHCLVSAAAG